MNEKKIIKIVFEFIDEAQQIAKQIQDSAKQILKQDDTPVTAADFKISDLAKKKLAEIVDKKYIITEESLENLKHLVITDSLKKSEILIFVDPIDGTRNYANKIPLYAISVGILKNLKPWLGFACFPCLNEIFYCNSKTSFFIKNTFSKKSEKIRLKPIEQNIEKNSIFLSSSDSAKKYKWNYDACMVNYFGCAVLSLCWPLIGRACGANFGAHIWDLAGSWPIFKNIGFDLRAHSSGEILNEFNINDYDSNWKLKEDYILSTKKNFQSLLNCMK